MNRWIASALAALMLLPLAACGSKESKTKNYDTIGTMSFSDISILTPEENETLASLQTRKNELVEAKDEEGIAALKAEWEEFSTPINKFISIYTSGKQTFFSSSEKALLSSEEATTCADYEARITAAYRSRNETELKTAISEWKTFSDPIRNVFNAYRSIEQPSFSNDERALLSREQIARMDELDTATKAALEERDLSTLKLLKTEWSDFAQDTKNVKKEYVTLSKFSVEGKWKNVGQGTFGQVQSGAIVVFDGTNCNVFSPKDTYAFYKDGDNYRLDCTSFLFSETLSFTVKLVDEDHMDIFTGNGILELARVE